MGLFLIDPPAAEPILLTQAKAQCRVEVADDDAIFTGDLIPTARTRVEDITGRQLITATWEDRRSGWPHAGLIGAATAYVGGGYRGGWIELPMPPLQSIESVKYLDADGVEQTWDPSLYVVDAPTGPRARAGRIAPAYGETWPVVLPQVDAIKIRFIAGYGDAGADVPAPLRRAMLLIIGSWYENRENEVIERASVLDISLSAQRLLKPYYFRPTQRVA
jgi:uncharacterized phiE125 gp8 family phage protein